MKKTSIFFALFSLLYVDMASAINIVSARGWGYSGATTYSGTNSPFVAGGVGKVGPHGTYGDEWGGVLVVATKIVEHGGYFCPYQLQCNNKRSKRWSYTNYYHPTGWSSGMCMWLCEDGYTGTNCAKAEAGECTYNDSSMVTNWSAVSMKESGGSAGKEAENEVAGFKQWGSDPECDVLLVAHTPGEHGAVVAPMTFCCGRDNWRSNDSFISIAALSTGGTEKLLCASGYAPNSNKNDCVKMTETQCSVQGMTFCSNFSSSGYDPAQHTLVKDGSCYKYFCPAGQAFTSESDTTCIECSTGVKGGSHSVTGLCVTCAIGQYFDSTTNSCKSAAAYTKQDMKYGKGKTKVDNPINRQCWTIATPEDYTVCVTTGGERIQADSSGTSTVRAVRQPIHR